MHTDTPRTFHAPRRTHWLDAMPWIAFGLVVGISFVAQPAKFLTQGLDLPQLVAVGSTLFHVSHAMQMLLLLPMILLPQRAAHPALAALFLSAFGAIVLAQELTLMPALDARLTLLQAGITPPSSMQHHAYIALELLKLGALLGLARQTRRTDQTRWPSTHRQTTAL